MGTMEDLQNGLRERAQWFRIGMISATVLTPLVTRWQSLRAAERARDLWEHRSVGARLPWTVRRAEAELPPAARGSQLSTGIWLAGAGVGLLVAGTVAFVIARRRIMSNDEAPLELTLEPSPNGNGRSLGERTRDLMERARPVRSAPTLAHEDTQSEDEDDTAPRMAAVGEPETTEPEEAQFVGDIKTLVYHEADDDGLPTAENRVYFANREQAEAAGFRPVKGEVAR
jgi:hypothetical protein